MVKKAKKTVAQKTRDFATQLELELVQYKLGNSAINFGFPDFSVEGIKVHLQ